MKLLVIYVLTYPEISSFTLKVWGLPNKIEKLKVLFGKWYELWGHILENELIDFNPSSLDTIQQLFTKFKFLALQCRQCGIERKDEKHVISILSKLGSKYYIFVSIFHSERASIPNWKMPSFDSFAESLIQEQEKLVHMGFLQNSKNQALLVTDSTNAQAKGRHKGKGPKYFDSNPI